MTRVHWLVLVAALGLGSFGFAATRPAADAPVPPGVAPWVEYAREMANVPRGVVELLWPLRFVEARCSDAPEGQLVLFVFEAADPSVRAYAVMHLPRPAPAGLDNAAVIGGLTPAQLAADFGAQTWAAC